MSVSIRLSKIGKKHAPAYRVVVSQSKTKRNGKFIDIIGNYNPLDPTKEFVIDKKKYEEWVKKGAIVSDAVKNLVDGKYEFVKYKPGKDGADKEGAAKGESEKVTADAEPSENETADSNDEAESEENKPEEIETN